VPPQNAPVALVAVELVRDYLHAMRGLDDGEPGGEEALEATHRLHARLCDLAADPQTRDLIGVLASLAACLASLAGRGADGAEAALDAMALHTLTVEAGGI
jgi:hypothetical protein